MVKSAVADKIFISVIVAARNEANNIGRLLTALSQQTYCANSFEVVIIDDYSTDNTMEVVKAFSLPNLVFTQPDVLSDLSSKKFRSFLKRGIALPT